MSFTDTYRHEIYLSRKDRARRALFLAKILSLVTLLTVGAILRAEPDLRRALMDAGIAGVMSVTGLETQTVARGPAALAPQTDSTLPTSRIKVNRPQNAASPLDARSAAQDLGLNLSGIKPGG